MRKITLLSLLAVLLISCQVTERIYLSELGTIRQEMDIDFTALMSFISTPEKMDSLREIGEFPVDKVVSILQAEELFQTEKSERKPAQEEFLKTFDKSNVRIVMNEEKASFTIFTTEMKVKEYNLYQEKIEKAYQEYMKKDPENAKGYSTSGFGTMLRFEYDGKKLERISLSEKVEIPNEEDEDSLGFSTRSFMDLNTYRIEYYFEKPIKKTTLKDAQIGPDGKVLTSEIRLSDILENPENYNFEVQF